MKFFYLASTPNDEGNYEIHERDCDLIPDILDREYLGPFNNGKEALRKALEVNPKANTCEKCSSSNFQAVFFKNN